MANRPAAIVRSALRPLVASSRLSVGPIAARGTASILLAAAGIVLAAGASSALERAATALPESLREARLLWLSVRAARVEITSASARDRA